MTASRRLPPLPFLRAISFALLALALGGVLFATVQPAQAQTATVLVKNTMQTDAGSHGLSLGANFKRAQAFTTGANPAGYTLSSIGFSFDSITMTSTAGANLVMTLNADSSGNPGAVLCTLTDPATFSGSGVQTFDAPTTDPCETLAKETTYFAVVERVATNPTATASLDITASDNEDTGGADGWSIEDSSYVVVSTLWVEDADFNYLVAVRGYANNNPATGAPTITGTLRVGEKLTADTSGISDADGTTSATFTYQWVRVDGMTNTNIGSDSSTYTLMDADADKQIKVDVTFTDDLSVPEGPLSSELTDTIAPSDLLVRNTTETMGSGLSLVANQPERAQAFTTGSYIAGYQLDSVGFLFENIANTATAGSQLEATLRSEESGNPGEALCTLTDPAAFSASGLHTFKAPTSGAGLCPTLTPGGTYFAVVERVTITSDGISLTTTASPTEHAGSAPGWSIENARQFYDTTNGWNTVSLESHLIEVKGEEHDQITVPVEWDLTPSGLTTGDKFRFIFLTGTGTRAPNSSDIEDYNTYVQSQAADTGSPPAHPSIVPYNTWFRVLGSTSDVDARDNTNTTSSDTAAAIYWLNGNKVADGYGDLYDGTWDDEANPRDRAGSTSSERILYTGTADNGTKSTLPLGGSTVSIGKLNDGGTNENPLGSSTGLDTSVGQTRPYYALSGVFVVPSTNSAPEFSAATTTRTLPENSGAGVNVVGGVITATDSDSGDTLTYSLTGTDAGSFEIDSSGQLKTKTGVTHSFDFESATKSYSVTVEVSDSKDAAGDADTVIDDTIAVTINLTNVDEAGTVTLPATFVGGTEATASVTDPDGTVSGESWRWARGDTATGSFSNIGGATSASYEPVAADVGKYLRATVTYTDPEGSGKTARAVSSSTVGGSNAEPTFDDGASTTRSFPENSGTGTDVGGVVAATDGDSDTLTYSMTGNTRFTINTSTGQIKTASGQSWNYEGTRNFQVTVNVRDSKDAAGNADTAVDDTITVAINLTNVNEAPEITTGPATIAKDENTQTTEVIATYEAEDVDVNSQFTWDLQGVDAGDFTITKNADGHGELKFKRVPNFEIPADDGADNEYNFTVRVRDGGGLSDTIPVTVTVTNVNETPEITTTTTAVEINENSTGVVTVTASDVDAMDTLSWSVESADDGGKFEINVSTGTFTTLSFKNAPDFETPTDVGATAMNNTYVVTVKVTDAGSLSDTLTVTVTVTNVNEAPVITTVSTTHTDFNVNENTATTDVIKTYVATDVDANTTLTWTLEGNDAGDFTITKNADGHGELTFANAPNFEMPVDANTMNNYDIRVKVQDNSIPGNRGSSNQLDDTVTVVVNVHDVNEAPVINGAAQPDFAEIEYDATSPDLTIGTYTYTDEDRNPADTITWRLSGADATHFNIGSSSGVLSFSIRPDFENPFGSDNEYLIDVRADDGQGGVTDFAVVVTVTNVDETPEITTTAAASHTAPSFMEIEYDATTADLTVADYDGRDEEGQTITWSRTGTDAGDFTIDSSTGVLSFAQRPNFENRRTAAATTCTTSP